jgi:hypothetical protein
MRKPGCLFSSLAGRAFSGCAWRDIGAALSCRPERAEAAIVRTEQMIAADDQSLSAMKLRFSRILCLITW